MGREVVAKEFATLELEGVTLTQQANAVTITDEITAQQASDLWAELDIKIKAGEQEFAEIDTPMKLARAKLKARFDVVAQPLRDVRAALNTAITGYRRSLELAAQIANQARADAAMEHTRSIAARTGRDLEEVKKMVPAPKVVEGAGRGYHTPGGAVTGQKLQKWEVVDWDKVPWEYNGVQLWKFDEGAVTKLRRAAGETLTDAPQGIRFYYGETLKRKA